MPSSTPVRTVMTTDVVTLRPDQKVEEAADVLAEHRIGAAPVVEDGKLVGLLRDGDLIVSEGRLHVPTVISFLGGEFVLPRELHHFEDELRRAVGATVADVMERKYPTIAPDATVEDLATLMHEADVTHVPVVEGDRVVGIVARGDLVKFLAVET